MLNAFFNKENIKSFYNSDRAVFMLCVGIALFFWMLIKLSKTSVSSIESGIYYNLPQGKTLRETPPKKVNVAIEGSGWDLIANYFNGKTNSIIFNLNDSPTQTIYQSQLKNKLSSSLDMRNIQITDVNLEFIQLELDDELIKKVPVVFDGDIIFAPTYSYKDSIKIEPDSISISGSLAYLDTIESWPTVYYKFEDLDENLNQSVDLYQESIQNISIQPKSVNLQIPVEQFTEKSVFVPIDIINATDSLKIFPQSVKLSYLVGLSRFDLITQDSFIVEVDAQKLVNSKSNTVALQLQSHPSNLKNIKMSPKSVEFFFIKKEEK